MLKMWFYPVLTILVAAAIVAVLVAMLLRGDTRSQLLLSLLAWAVVIVAYVVLRRIAGPAVAEAHITEQGLAAEQRRTRGCTSTARPPSWRSMPSSVRAGLPRS